MLQSILKLLLSLAILFYLFYADKLGLSLLPNFLKHPLELSLFILILLLAIPLTAYRWGLILTIKTKAKLSISFLTKLTWIGMFFSNLLPGAITGDLIKLFYIRNSDSNLSSFFLFTSILLDRLLGLLALSFLSCFCALIYHFTSSTAQNGQLISSLVFFNIALFFLLILCFLLFFLPKNLQKKISQILKKLPLIGNKAEHLFKELSPLAKNKKILAKGFLLSLILQFLVVFSYWLVLAKMNPSLTLTQAMLIIPLGLILIAIPISPAGLGVGHLIFQGLFQIMNLNSGASFFNLYFFCFILTNLPGCLFWISYKKKKLNFLLHLI